MTKLPLLLTMKILQSTVILYTLPTQAILSFISAIYGLADTGPGDLNSEGSGSDDGQESNDDECSADESSDDDLVIEFDDMYPGGDPLDLDYED